MPVAHQPGFRWSNARSDRSEVRALTLSDYLLEDGSGTYRSAFVPDLVPTGKQRIELLFVLESPHVDELASGTPVVGNSGRDALRYLLDDPYTPDSLGAFVKRRHDADDYRIAIMNVCNVPMQSVAHAGGSPPGISLSEWNDVGRARTSSARHVSSIPDSAARGIAASLLPRFQARLNLLQTGKGFTLVACGRFAARSSTSISLPTGTTTLVVPHPSMGNWQRKNFRSHVGLMETRELFQGFV